MILLSLTMKNFKQYRDQALEFREGLIGIIGKNGAGKSTLFEAVLLALYGELPLTKDYLRNSAAGEKEPVSVALDFEVEGRRYRVTREYRGKALAPSGRLYNHADELVAEGQKETTAEVTKLLGMGCDAFTRSIFAGQKELGALSGARGGDRRELVRRMVGMEKLDHIQKLVREDRNRLKNELAGMERMLLSAEEAAAKKEEKEKLAAEAVKLESEVAALAEKLAAAQKAYEEAKKTFAGRQRQYRAYTDANARHIKAGAAVKSARESLEKSGARLGELRAHEKELAALAPAVREYGEVKQRKEELDALKIAFQERAGLLKQKDQQRKECEEMTAEREAGREAAANLAGAEAALAKEREDIALLDKQIEAAREKDTALKAEAGKLRQLAAERAESVQKITAAGPDSVCPTCLRPLQEAYRDTLDRLNADIERYAKKETAALEAELKAAVGLLKELNGRKKERERALETARKQLAEKEQLEKNLASLAERLKKKNELIAGINKNIEALGEVPYDEKRHGELIKRLSELEPGYKNSLELSGRVKEIPRLEEEIAAGKETLEKLEAEERDRKKELAAVPHDEKAYREAERAQAEREEERDRLRDELDKKKHTHREAHQKAMVLDRELKEDRKRRGQLQKSREEMVRLEKLSAHMDGFKTAVLERVRPSIARYAGELFAQCTRGRYEFIKVDENFDFFIMDEGEYYPINRFSGGEVDLANLCLRVAISRVIAELAGAGSTGFLGFDEIFGSQDSERRYEILSAFQHLRERYRQIFIVSHIDDVKEEFPVILEVSRTPSGSAIRWVDGG